MNKEGLKKADCPFCNKEIISKQSVFSTAFYNVLYSLTPTTIGHLLVIPKRHFITFEEISKEELKESKGIALKLSKAFKELYHIDDYLILQKNGIKAGQTVEHVHFHVVPCNVSVETLADKMFFYRPNISKDEMSFRTGQLKKYFMFNKRS